MSLSRPPPFLSADTVRAQMQLKAAELRLKDDAITAQLSQSTKAEQGALDALSATVGNDAAALALKANSVSPVFTGDATFDRPPPPAVVEASDLTWTSQYTAGFDFEWRGIAWAPTLEVDGRTGVFVAVGAGGCIMTSPDGTHWTQRVSPSSNDWTSVTWSPELGIFVAVAESGASHRLMSSTDGITWTERQIPLNHNWQSV